MRLVWSGLMAAGLLMVGLSVYESPCGSPGSGRAGGGRGRVGRDRQSGGRHRLPAARSSSSSSHAMSQPAGDVVRRPETQERRTPRSGGVADTAPTIVIAGVVHHLEGLQGLGHLQRARWSLVGPYAARWPADLVVVGRPLPGVDAVAVIAGLKDDLATRAIPVLHAPSDAGCEECRADVCLSGGWSPGQLERVSRVLLELGQARARVEPVGPLERRPAPHAERMEALGRLTGGIVHDFNNLLFVITGQIELARRQLTADHPAFARLAPALQAAERAAALNRELLAFGRGSPRIPARWTSTRWWRSSTACCSG